MTLAALKFIAENIQISGTVESEISKLSELHFLALDKINTGGTILSNSNKLTDIFFLGLHVQ